MRGAVFHHAVSIWHCSVLIELYIEANNCQLWRMGMIHVVFKAFCTRKERKLRVDKLFISFLSQ